MRNETEGRGREKGLKIRGQIAGYSKRRAGGKGQSTAGWSQRTGIQVGGWMVVGRLQGEKAEGNGQRPGDEDKRLVQGVVVWRQ